MDITTKNKSDFFKKGWTKIDLKLSEGEINRYFNALERLRDKANKINYPFRICYYPHITSDNIAGIEAPFNRLIMNEDVKEFFSKIELGKAIREIMGWKEAYLTLARLFTMKGYNYRGQWHRDQVGNEWDGNVKNISEIQVAIYLKKQDGFRILNLNREIWSSEKNSLKETPVQSYLPLTIDDQYFSEISGSPGSLVLFVPDLMHQGNSNTQRLDFHFRFSKLTPNPKRQIYSDNLLISEETNSYFDFKFLNIYSENYPINNDLFTHRYQKPKMPIRILNSLNYYTAGFNLIRYMKNIYKPISSPWEIDIFANTIFQNLLNNN